MKLPPVDDTADTSETITLPRKCCGATDIKKCQCSTTSKEDKPEEQTKCECSSVEKCSCRQKSDEQTVRKPLPSPGEGQSKDDFISACMTSLNGEFPDEKQRYAVCNSQWTEKAEQTEKSAEKRGMMLALTIPEDVAKRLVQKGGLSEDDLHVTLGYYGEVGKDFDEKHVDAVEKCVQMSAKGYTPIKAHIGGVGRFNASNTSDGKDVLIAHVDSPGLHDVRDHLIAQVKKCSGIAKAEPGSIADKAQQMYGMKEGDGGITPKRDHGYTPHITLAYIDQDADMPLHKLKREEFTFTHLLMAVGKERKLFPLGETISKNHTMWCPIIKADEKRLVTGIVLQPEVVDAQGDIIGAEVISSAAHNFLAYYNKKTQLGLQHEVFKVPGIELVESWVAPVDMKLNGRDILAGTWMMTVRVMNDEVWNRVKSGSLTGFSIGGVAKVRKLVA